MRGRQQAAGYLEELGLADDRSGALREQAATHLLSAGIRALELEDGRAAESLLRRAESLTDESSRTRLEALTNLGRTHALLMRLPDFEATYARLLTAAEAVGDEGMALVARLELNYAQSVRDPARSGRGNRHGAAGRRRASAARRDRRAVDQLGRAGALPARRAHSGTHR